MLGVLSPNIDTATDADIVTEINKRFSGYRIHFTILVCSFMPKDYRPRLA